MPFALIPFLLLVIPVLEIAVFILVGNLIGLWPTLALVVVTAIGGSILLKQQGIGTLNRIQSEMAAGRVPGRELVDGVMILAAGILLLTPGLVTDAIGFLLFVPGVRSTIRRVLSQRIVVMTRDGTAERWQSRRPGGPSGGEARRGGPDVVDLSGDDYQRRPDPTSPWHGDDHENESPPNRTLH